MRRHFDSKNTNPNDTVTILHSEESESDSSSSGHKERRPDSEDEIQNMPVKITLNNTVHVVENETDDEPKTAVKSKEGIDEKLEDNLASLQNELKENVTILNVIDTDATAAIIDAEAKSSTKEEMIVSTKKEEIKLSAKDDKLKKEPVKESFLSRQPARQTESSKPKSSDPIVINDDTSGDNMSISSEDDRKSVKRPRTSEGDLPAQVCLVLRNENLMNILSRIADISYQSHIPSFRINSLNQTKFQILDV